MADETPKPVPRATYRVQLHEAFGFDQAAGLADYLARLGVSHLYTSPYLKARPGSTHGYDIVAHDTLNPELGGEAGFRRLASALRDGGLGQILDFVPNHMGVGGADNPWWLDVLEWGQNSPCAGYFDIDWNADRADFQGKVLVPFLGDQYGRVLQSGGLELRFDAEAGSFAVWAYGTHKLPVCPLDYGGILGNDHPELERLGDAFGNLLQHQPNVIRRAGELKAELAALVAARPEVAEAVEAATVRLAGREDDAASWDALDRLIRRQHWRAAHFRVAADDINYRRFFNINELAGLRMEQPELFDVAHRLVLDLVADGTLDGLRIDHIDGLLDPKAYCLRLRDKAARPFYLVVEKILAHHEHLRNDWPIEGTTGYEFANLVGGLFVDPAGEEPLGRFYAAFTGQAAPFAEIVRASKLRIMKHEMASELNVLARQAARIARSNRCTADFTVNALHAALREVVACFPVYRTYVDENGADAIDRRDIDWAVAQAEKAEDAPDPSVLDFVHRLLTGDLVAQPKSGYSRSAVLRFAMKMQQYSGPVMAKGLEDTAFYRYNRLVALNEVGGHPDRFGVSIAAFHQANAERARRWPQAMLGTSTHDTKRGEDTRARLYVRSELAPEWESQVQAWTRLARARRGDIEGTAPPDRNDEYLFYQLLVGAWPAEMTGMAADTLDPAAVGAFAERIEGAMIKAVREAKVHSTWASPNQPYEEAVKSFVRGCLDVAQRNAFLEMALPFQERVARLGVINSLAQTLLKLTVPGVPDIYQGAELWDLSMVDPDNRRPVDYEERRRLLDEVEGLRDPEAVAGLLDRWKDGAVKLALVVRTLALRRQRPALFAEGRYEALEAAGERAQNLCAFARLRQEEAAVVVVPRLVAALDARHDWADTTVSLPAAVAARAWRNVLTGRVVDAEARGQAPVLRAADLFRGFPAALLVPEGA